MSTLILQTLEFVEAERKATVLLQRGDKMFIGLVIKRVRGNKQYHCVYVGLDRNQYKKLIRDHEFADLASFIGISSGSIDCKKLLCDKLLLDQPTHFVGEVTPDGHALTVCLTTLADVVYNQLESVDAN